MCEQHLNALFKKKTIRIQFHVSDATLSKYMRKILSDFYFIFNLIILLLQSGTAYRILYITYNILQHVAIHVCNPLSNGQFYE